MADTARSPWTARGHEDLQRPERHAEAAASHTTGRYEAMALTPRAALVLALAQYTPTLRHAGHTCSLAAAWMALTRRAWLASAAPPSRPPPLAATAPPGAWPLFAAFGGAFFDAFPAPAGSASSVTAWAAPSAAVTVTWEIGDGATGDVAFVSGGEIVGEVAPAHVMSCVWPAWA